MTVKVRSGVFETNSSSSHSLVLADGFTNMVEPPIPDSMMDDGAIHVFSGEYGWEIETYYDVSSKLSYLYTDAMIGETDADPNDKEYQESNKNLKLIVDAVKQYAGVDVVFHKEISDYHPFGYIDHQSVGLISTVWDAGIDGVIRFVFSNDSSFETDNDNH